MSIPKEKIAIVGTACRFPGGCHSAESFWDFLVNKKDAMTDIPLDRWDHKKFYSPNPEKPGKTYVKQAAFLQHDIKSFDPAFFGISPREAEAMDPQQRLILEVAWESIEDSGIPLQTLQKRSTGVFVGGFLSEHLVQSTAPGSLQNTDSMSPTSVNLVMLSNKISYVFDLKGPSFSVDTACSSSLLAIYLACRSLQNGDSQVALAGGVNVMQSPLSFILMSKGRFLSEHGRSKMGSSDASGYARGEGAGVVVLKRLEDAIRDHDQIHAVISAINSNQDGRTPGITLPSQDAQYNLIMETLKQANISPEDVDYVEAHGTGTKAGDKVELTSIANAFRSDTDKTIVVGSVKTNMGHLEAASGVAGLIKATLCLEKQQVPANLHFDKPNPDIDFSKIIVPTDSISFSKLNYVGINSFGYGGSNVFAILEPAPQRLISSDSHSKDFSQKRLRLVPVTAHSKEALRQRVQDILFWMSSREIDMDTLIYSLTQKKSQLSHRAVFFADSIEALAKEMTDYLAETGVSNTTYGVVQFDNPDNVFIYTGMGPQWAGMGHELYHSEPVFKQKVDDIDLVFYALAGWSIKEALLKTKSESAMEKTSIAQPANFVMQVGLTALLESYGITPKAVIGHSVGEVAAAYVSGALSLEDAVKVSFHRSRLQQTLSGKGGMLAVGLDINTVESYLTEYENLEIAAVNSPTNITIAGDLDSIQKFSNFCTEKQIFNRSLNVEVAYHSFVMEPIKAEVLSALSDICPQESKIPMISTVTGEQIHGKALDAEYWWNNIRQPVYFEKGIRTILEQKLNIFLEVGPHPVLKNALSDIKREVKADFYSYQTLNMKSSEHLTFNQSVGILYSAGFNIDFNILNTSYDFYSLPSYPWQHQRFWREPRSITSFYNSLPGPTYFSEQVDSGEMLWKTDLNDVLFPFIQDHIVNDSIVFPGAGYVDVALSLSRKLYPQSPTWRLDGIEFDRMLIIEPNITTQLFTKYDNYLGRVEIKSLINPENPTFTRHAVSEIVVESIASERPQDVDISLLKSRMSNPIDGGYFYELLSSIGLCYGQTFQSIESLYRGESDVLVFLKTSYQNPENTVIAPPLLDGAIQSVIGILGGRYPVNSPFVPVNIAQIIMFEPIGQCCICHTRLLSFDGMSIICDLTFLDESGRVLGFVKELKCQKISGNASEKKYEKQSYIVKWVVSERPVLEESKLLDRHWGLFLSQASRLEEKFLEMHLQSLKRRSLFFESDSFQKLEDGLFTINKANTRDIKQVLVSESITDVVFLWSLEEASKEELISKQVEKLSTSLAYIADSLPTGGSITIITHKTLVMDDETICFSPAFGLIALPQLIENEYPHLSCRIIDIDDTVESLVNLQYSLFSDSKEKHLILREGTFFASRLSRYQHLLKTKLVSPQEQSIRATFDQPGPISNMYFVQSARQELQEHDVEIQVKSLGLNLKDALKITGKLDRKAIDETYIGSAVGMEASGIISRVGSGITQFKSGDEVFGMLPTSFGTYVVGEASLVVKKPSHFSFDESHLLVTFIASFYGLIECANLQEGETVLIHNGAGGIGLAAIQIAQWRKANIITTTSSEEKRKFLNDYGVEHVFNSRSLSFTTDILSVTNGLGVDVVINALSGPMLLKSFELLKSFGRFIEIGKKDITENTGLPMHVFNKGVSFISIDIDRMHLLRPDITATTLNKLYDLFLKGILKPLPTQCFDLKDIHQAIVYLLKSKHIGKIALRVTDEPIEIVEHNNRKIQFSSQKTYVITGGTSGFGLEVAKWIATQGAKHILLLSRRGEETPGLSEKKAFFEIFGVTLRVEALDITQKEPLRHILNSIEQSDAPIGGIFNGAMVLDDFAIRDVTSERMMSVLSPKIDGAMSLFEACKCLNSLDFLVHFSSISSIIGNKNQLSYVVANTFLDQFSRYCRQEGIPSMTINWGVLKDAGVVQRNEELAKLLDFSGIHAYTNREAFDLLRQALDDFPVQIGLFDIRWGKSQAIYPALQSQQMFVEFASSDHHEFADNAFIQAYLQIPESSQLSMVLSHLKEVMAKTTRLSSEKMDSNVTLNELGIDSLMSVELLVGIQNHFTVRVNEMNLMSNPKLTDLASIIRDQLNAFLNVQKDKSEKEVVA